MLPPKPKLLIAARRGLPEVFQSSGFESGWRAGEESASIRSPLRGMGGRVSFAMACVSFRRLARPATVIRWPVLALSEPMGSSRSVPKTLNAAAISTLSPTGVPVAWHSRKSRLSGAMPASA